MWAEAVTLAMSFPPGNSAEHSAMGANDHVLVVHFWTVPEGRSYDAGGYCEELGGILISFLTRLTLSGTPPSSFIPKKADLFLAAPYTESDSHTA